MGRGQEPRNPLGTRVWCELKRRTLNSASQSFLQRVRAPVRCRLGLSQALTCTCRFQVAIFEWEYETVGVIHNEFPNNVDGKFGVRAQSAGSQVKFGEVFQRGNEELILPNLPGMELVPQHHARDPF